MSRDAGDQDISAAYRWNEALRRAIRRNRRDAHNRYLQLATLRADGTPAVRTLVFREFCDLSLELRMVTDRRSAKVGEIEACPRGEAGWYFTHTREQFRLRGGLRLEDAGATPQHARHKLWNSLSEKAREQFFWPDPGLPLGEALPGAEVPGEDGPPDNFLLLAMVVEEVDHLTLRGDPHTRMISRCNEHGTWLSEAVNP